MDPAPWFPDLLAECIRDGLRQAADEREREQAVRGLDSLDELRLHGLILTALEQAGYGAWPEERYPADRGHRKRSQGRRCDLVVTPPGCRVADPGVQGSLYASADTVPPSDAYWLEVKTVRQYGPEGANRNYSGWLLGEVAGDLPKMTAGSGILHAGLLLVMFTADLETAHHDLGAWQFRCRRRGLPVSSPFVHGFPLNDRLGNGYAAVALFPIRPGLTA